MTITGLRPVTGSAGDSLAVGAWWVSATVVLAALCDAVGAITGAAAAVTLAGLTWRLYRRCTRCQRPCSATLPGRSAGT